MSSGKVRNLTCRVNPLVIATISDAFLRRQEGNSKCIGTLMGYVDGNSLVIADAFMVLHKENEDGTFSLDKDYHRKMVALKKKVCPTESVIGWFSTCDEIEAGFVAVQSFYATSNESRFVASALCPAPVLLTIDPSLSTNDLNIKVSIMQTTVGAETLVQFHQLPVSFESVHGVTNLLARSSQLPVDLLLSEGVVGDLKTLATAPSITTDVAMSIQSWKNATHPTTTETDDVIERINKLVSTDNEICI